MSQSDLFGGADAAPAGEEPGDAALEEAGEEELEDEGHDAERTGPADQNDEEAGAGADRA